MKWNIPIAIAATILNTALAVHLGVAIWWAALPIATILVAASWGGPWIARGVYSAAISTFVAAVIAVLFMSPEGLFFFLPEIAYFWALWGGSVKTATDANNALADALEKTLPRE